MSDQGMEISSDTNQKCTCPSFVRIFRTFRIARHWGTLMLGLLGVVILFVGGWILDGLAGSARVVSDVALVQVSRNSLIGNDIEISELTAYSMGLPESRQDPAAFREKMLQSNDRFLISLMNSADLKKMNLGLADLANSESIRDGDAFKKIKESFKEYRDRAIDKAQTRYAATQRSLEKDYDRRIENSVDDDKRQKRLERDQKLADLESAYHGILQALAAGDFEPAKLRAQLNKVVIVIPSVEDKADEAKTVQKYKDELYGSVQLANLYRAAEHAQGRGLFATIVDFKLDHMHGVFSSLIFDGNIKGARQHITEFLMGLCWMSRTHPIYMVFLTLLSLSVWALIGGAICRMAALQLARDEWISPKQALQFSAEKFWHFLAAPLLPVGIIVLVSILIFLGGILGAVPVLGEILSGILLIAGLFGGLVIALVSMGLLGGFNLMHPTIAVEGSDSFDAISRSFSYVFSRPWRWGFYSLIAAAYGGICYFFVRLFVFIMLASVRVVAGASINLDGSSYFSEHRKLDVMWPMPSWSVLQKPVDWINLNWSESFGAFIIWILVALVVGLLLAFVISFFFSANTVIYYLLRKSVDGIDLEDVFVEQDAEELLDDAPADEPTAEETTESSAAEPESSSEPDTTEEPDEKPGSPEPEDGDPKNE